MTTAPLTSDKGTRETITHLHRWTDTVYALGQTKKLAHIRVRVGRARSSTRK